MRLRRPRRQRAGARYLYCRDNDAKARQAKVLTKDRLTAGLLRHPREQDSLKPLRVAFAPDGEFDDAPGYPEREDVIPVRQAEFGEDNVEGRTHDGDDLGVERTGASGYYCTRAVVAGGRGRGLTGVFAAGSSITTTGLGVNTGEGPVVKLPSDMVE
jgi:hypothetical protein